MRYHLLLQTLESFCRICILTEKNVKLFSLTFFAITHPFDGLVGNPDSSQFQICDESIQEKIIIENMTEKQINNISFTYI